MIEVALWRDTPGIFGIVDRHAVRLGSGGEVVWWATTDRIEGSPTVGIGKSTPGFHDHAKIVNCFRNVIVEVWEDASRHARSAPGQGPSPFDGRYHRRRDRRNHRLEA